MRANWFHVLRFQWAIRGRHTSIQQKNSSIRLAIIRGEFDLKDTKFLLESRNALDNFITDPKPIDRLITVLNSARANKKTSSFLEMEAVLRPLPTLHAIF